jgi:hypothetical protein
MIAKLEASEKILNFYVGYLNEKEDIMGDNTLLKNK